MTDEDLRLLHPARVCETAGCGREIEARLNEVAIDQSDGKRPAAVYECECGRTVIVPLQPVAYRSNGWTASISPCRRKNDVQPR